MILPSNALLASLGLWLASAVAAAVEPALLPACSALGGAIVLWGVIDYWQLRSQDSPVVQRVVNSSLPLGVWSPIDLHLHWPGKRRPVQVQVFDHPPAALASEGLPARITTGRQNTFTLRYRVRPVLRGDHAFAQVELRQSSPLRAWLQQLRITHEQPVRVYPNFAPLAGHALLAADYRNARFGLQQRQRRGQGMDFAQLREYREGDSMRQIDWKASTRTGKMISREYQDERDQRILLLVDCGRRMGARDGDLSHFDHALDTVLLLAYAALNHGDRVGLMTLGGPERYLPTQHAASTVSLILRETYDLQPTLQVSDFERAAHKLLARERKRALVVLLTNLRDEDDQSLLAATRLLRQRHLVLVASLRESALDRAQQGEADNSHAAARQAAAVGYARRREAALRRLRAEGVLCLDVAPEHLAVETVNRYLAIKAASQL